VPTATTATVASASSLAPPAGFAYPSGPVTVTFQHGSDVTTVALYQQTFIPAYTKLHPNVTIQDEALPGIDQKLLVEFATGAAPTIIEANALSMKALIAKGVLSPVPPADWGVNQTSDMLSTYYLPGLMDWLMKDGQLYGIPNQMNSSSLMINTRLFKAAGLDPVKDAPRTWDDVARLNPTLTKRDSASHITQKGFDWIFARPDVISGSIQLLIYQAGGSVLADDGVTPMFDGDAGVNALQVIKKLAIDPTVTQNTTAVVQMDFAAEQNVLYTGGPNTGVLCEAINPNLKGNYIYSDLPQLDPGKPSATFTLFTMAVNGSATADQQAVAHDFLRFMALQPDAWLAQTGQLTPVVSLKTSQSARQIMPFLDVALHDLEIARPPTNTDFGSQLNTALSAAAERVVMEGQDPKESLAQARADFTESIKS
jgi:multiple sugar transport system substrate-binding protein